MSASSENPEGAGPEETRSRRRSQDFDGYPSSSVRIGIRAWGTPEEKRVLREWETFMRGVGDQQPARLNKWTPRHELAESETARIKEVEREQEALRLKQQETNGLMKLQIQLLEASIGKGFVRSPVLYLRYPSEIIWTKWSKYKRSRDPKMYGRYRKYVLAWDEFMSGEREFPPPPVSFWTIPRQPEEYAMHPGLEDLKDESVREWS